MINKIKIFFPLLIVAFSLVIFLFHLNSSFIINTDYGRDLFVVGQILKGNITLIGPALSSGFYSGPYYYYLWVLPLWLSHWNPNSILISNAFMFASFAGLVFIFYAKNMSLSRSVLSTLVMILSPLFLISARFPANGFTYLPFLFLFLFLTDFKLQLSPFYSLLMGFLAGLLANFHPVTLLATIPAFIFTFFKLAKISKLLFVIGFVISFAPLGLFEIRHNFIISKGFFVQKSYQGFVYNDVVENSISGYSNPIKNYRFLSPYISNLVIFSPLVLIILGIIAILKSNKASQVWIFSSIISLILTVVSVRFRFQYHYLFPLAALTLFATLNFCTYFKKGYILLIIFLGLEIVNFPARLYAPGNRQFSQFQSAVDFTINSGLVKPGDSFNLIAVADKHIYVPVGNEYRFAYLKRGFKTLNETTYSSANKLVIFSEIGPFPPDKIHIWATDQFGSNYLTNYDTYNISPSIVYTVTK